MGFTWIHLNQVNVGTNVAIGCALYRRWCTLTGVSTCATVNTCIKHKKRCSKGKHAYVYSMYTKDKRIRSAFLKKDRDSENNNTWTKMALLLQAGGLPNATQAYQDSSVSPPKPVRPGSVEVPLTNRDSKRPCWQTISSEPQPALHECRISAYSRPCTYLEAFSTYLNTQPLHPPTTAPEDASIPDNPSEHHLGKHIIMYI